MKKQHKVNNDISSPLWTMEAYLDDLYLSGDMKTYGVVRRLARSLGMKVEPDGMNHICTWERTGKWAGKYED